MEKSGFMFYVQVHANYFCKFSLYAFCLFLFTGCNDTDRLKPYYVGLSMDFAPYLQKKGIIFKENGKPKDPFIAIKDHGANIVRLHDMFGPYEAEYSKGEPPVDWGSFENVKENIWRSKKLGLSVFLTLTYKGFHRSEIHNTIPDEWADINDVNVLSEKVYRYAYDKLDALGKEKLLPNFISVGNEINTDFLAPKGKQGYDFDPKRKTLLINSAFRAIDEINAKYNKNIRKVVHIFSPEHVKWWMSVHWPAGLQDWDILGISYYYGWHKMGEWKSFGEMADWLKTEYGKKLMIVETSAPWTDKGNDNRVDTYKLVAPGYPAPPTPQGQKEYLTNLTREVICGGGLGVIYWGGDWVGSNHYVLLDEWGKGSSWENNAFWDFEYNLHEGVDWMMQDYSKCKNENE
jgi:arabinogalactan endo-1,4-beta-galactosidase